MSLSKVPDVYDFINLENVSAKDYLDQDPSNIIIVIGNSSMGYSKQDLYKSSLKNKDYFYECKKKGGLRVIKADLVGVPYAVIRGQGNYYVNVADLKSVIKSKHRVFNLIFVKDVKYMASKNSIDEGNMQNWRGQQINLVSSWHCQEGTNVKVYRLEPYGLKLDNLSPAQGPIDNVLVKLLEFAPDSVIFQILLNIPQEDLEYFCAINKRVRKVCASQNIKAEYYKKNLFETDDIMEAVEYIKRNPTGLLYLKLFKSEGKNVKIPPSISGRIMYFDTNAVSNPDSLKNYIGHFKNLKRLRIFNGNRLQYEIHYQNKKRNGLFREWHDNGTLWIDARYKKGNFDGLYREWNDDGKIDTEINYKNGQKDGRYREWFKNGLKVDAIYKNNQLNGLYKSWHENGKPEIEATYKDGELNGLYRLWTKKGELLEDEMYVNGVTVELLN
ncbi:MAG TPA: toxin-antitoxin system YwqK family antitoxin [Saprospiraceae bacterium]|nr:toxin-antitoxin system YwqK family antitoxin [Saprospiraceae bacterium]